MIKCICGKWFIEGKAVIVPPGMPKLCDKCCQRNLEKVFNVSKERQGKSI